MESIGNFGRRASLVGEVKNRIMSLHLVDLVVFKRFVSFCVG